MRNGSALLPGQVLPPSTVRALRRAYYSAVSHMDEQLKQHQPHMEAEHICSPLAAAMSTCSPPRQLSGTKTSTPARAQTCRFISPLLAMQCVVHQFLLREQPERDAKPRFEVDFLPGKACRKAASDAVVESAAVLFLMKHSRS